MSSPVKIILLVLLASFVFSLIGGCQGDAHENALIGAGIGTAIGAIASGGSSEGMLIGAGAGTLAGYFLTVEPEGD